MADAQYVLKVDAEEVEDGWGGNLVLNGFKDVELEVFDVLNGQFGVSNLLVHHLHFQRVDIFVLRCDKHRGDADDVEVGDLERVLLVLEVPVKKRD